MLSILGPLRYLHRLYRVLSDGEGVMRFFLSLFFWGWGQKNLPKFIGFSIHDRTRSYEGKDERKYSKIGQTSGKSSHDE